MKDPIIVTGCARSGTSLTAGVIYLCGAFGGNLAGPQRENKRGMFENLEIRNGVIKPFLRKIGADPQCQKPLPNMNRVRDFLSDGFVTNWRNQVRKIYLKHGYYDGPWFCKDPKITVHWPIWNAAFPEAKWVIVRRDGQDIINSCLKTGFMRAYHNREGWKEWVITHHQCFHEMIQTGLEIRQVWPQDMIDGDLIPIRNCVEDFLGLEWNEKQVLTFIAPALWSNIKRKRNGKDIHRQG